MSSVNSKKICVFCGSSIGNDPEFLSAAFETGKLIAEKGMEIVYGGGNVGLMGMVAKGALESGGRVTGVITEKLFEMRVASKEITELKIVKTMHQRKSLMSQISDVFISLPGGIGTLEETFEIFTWLQLGYIDKPIGLLNTSGYFDSLLLMIDNMVNKGFLRSEHKDYLIVKNSPEELLNDIFKIRIKRIEKWFDKDKNRIKIK